MSCPFNMFLVFNSYWVIGHYIYFDSKRISQCMSDYTVFICTYILNMETVTEKNPLLFQQQQKKKTIMKRLDFCNYSWNSIKVLFVYNIYLQYSLRFILREFFFHFNILKHFANLGHGYLDWSPSYYLDFISIEWFW